MTDRPARSAVPIEQTWDLEPLFPDTTAWEHEATSLSQALQEMGRWHGRLGESAASLLGALQAMEAVSMRLLRLDTYASNRRQTESGDAAVQAIFAALLPLSAAAGAALAFVQSEILALPAAQYNAFLAAEPALLPYQPFIERHRQLAEHTLSPETEEALAALGGAISAPYAIHLAIDTDITYPALQAGGESLPMTAAAHEALLSLPDRELRRRAHAALGEGLAAHKTAMAAALAAHVQNRVALARVHRYDSALEASLKRSQVPVAVYNTALDVMLREGAVHTRRFLDLRRRLLGVDRLMHYDVKAPLDPAAQEPVPFASAAAEIQAALAVLGPDYREMLRRAFAERWIDWADNEGKGHGAFCSDVYGWHPTVFTNWHNQVRDMLVLAHELGHAGHAYLANRAQPFINAGFGEALYFIEAPSTCNELLLSQYLLRRDTEVRQRRRILQAILDTFWHNMVTHLLQAEVERRLYALAESGKPVTLHAICEAQEGTFADYFGDRVGLTETDRLIWEMVPHYYMGFYPLVYGAGLSAAAAVATAISTEGAPAVQRWLSALSAGTSREPLALYQLAGIDMTRPEIIRAGVAYYGQLVSELEACYP